MNPTETPGGSGIPAGWYDDPRGDDLRWWDGERWTEHVHARTGEAAESRTEASETGQRDTTSRETAANDLAMSEVAADEVGGDATDAADAESEGAPPRDLVKLRESIRARGVSAVGMVAGAAVLVIVVIALLVSGGSGGSEGATEPGAAVPGAGKVDAAPSPQAKLKKVEKRLRRGNLSQSQRKKLKAKKRRLERAAGSGRGAR